MKKFIFLCLIFGSLQLSVLAQSEPEIVPAEHPIYDFLHLQRVKGILPEYIHESRPISRGQVITFLEKMQIEKNQFSPKMWTWLQQFRQEFLEPAEKVETVLGKGTGNSQGKTTFQIPLGKDTEKFFYYHKNKDWRTAIDVRGYGQMRTGRNNDVGLGGVAVMAEASFQGHYQDWLGFHSNTFNGWQMGGNKRVLKLDPDINTMYYIRIEDPPVGSFDRTSASMRLQKGAFFGEIANERLIFGSSFSDPLVLASGSEYLPFARVGFQTKKVQFQYVHANLGTQSKWKGGSGDGIGQLVSSERHLAIHRVTVSPSQKTSFSFSEMIVYGLRGAELGYLNPFLPFKTMEHALWDRDNILFELEAVHRPKRGIEAHASIAVDDLNFSLIGKNSYHVKWAFQSGVGMPIQDNILASLEYTRIEPFMYTHRFIQDGLYYNSYQHSETPLANPIGPNSDQWNLGVKAWFPKRLRAKGNLFYNRQGENYTENGKFINVGGDLLNGELTNYDLNNRPKIFLDGTLRKGLGANFSVEYEPIRNILLRMSGNFQAWNNAPSVAFVKTEFVLDF